MRAPGRAWMRPETPATQPAWRLINTRRNTAAEPDPRGRARAYLQGAVEVYKRQTHSIGVDPPASRVKA